MKLSRYFLPTLREAPQDADNVSVKLMFRAGMIRKLASGIYEWLPLGLRVLQKIENIVREELNRVDGQEVRLPVIQPKELWMETGRWQVYGKELLRLADRKESEFCFAPTAEEVITNMVRRDVGSWRQLPLLLYQFGQLFRRILPIIVLARFHKVDLFVVFEDVGDRFLGPVVVALFIEHRLD